MPIKIYCVQTGIFCKSSLQWPHRDQFAGGGVVVIRSFSYQIQIKSDHQSALEQVSVAVWKNVEKNTYTVLQINISNYFIGKNKQNFVFFVSFFFRSFFFSLHISNLDQPLASVVLPTIPSHLLCFVSLCWVPRSIYIFGIVCHYFARARGVYKSPACRNLCIIKLLLLWPDTGQHIGGVQKY